MSKPPVVSTPIGPTAPSSTDRTLRWDGWGYADTTYSLEHRPDAWRFFQAGVGLEGPLPPPVAREPVGLRPSRLLPAALAALRQAVGEAAVTTGDEARLMHARGRSYRDLIQLRLGDIPNPPDAVVFPSSEDQVLRVLGLAGEYGLAVIPFGGGSSVVGGVEPRGPRPALALSLARLNRVLAIDSVSHTANLEAGIYGPALEDALGARGFTLGHFPQSFEFSTLGGWIATRGAGEASTKYGKIEDRVVSLRLATPGGMIETRRVPASAAGPALLQLLIGCEGQFGVITSAVVRLSPSPSVRRDHSLVFRDFRGGVEALRSLLQQGIVPAVVRLFDEPETGALFAMREAPHGLAGRLRERAARLALALNRLSLERGALCILGFEGTDERVLADSAAALAECRRRGAFDLGPSVARRLRRDRYHTPYLRDVLMERGLLVDTLETATPWDNLDYLYTELRAALARAIEASGSRALVFNHISHVYPDGASLYLTFMARRIPGREIAQWQSIKDAATDCLMRCGGTLTHQHGVGYEHARWLNQELTPAGLAALHAVKRQLDPMNLLNPGKFFGE
jgi:alkyldihydroxyacetonephosphate synthase